VGQGAAAEVLTDLLVGGRRVAGGDGAAAASSMRRTVSGGRLFTGSLRASGLMAGFYLVYKKYTKYIIHTKEIIQYIPVLLPIVFIISGQIRKKANPDLPLHRRLGTIANSKSYDLRWRLLI